MTPVDRESPTRLLTPTTTPTAPVRCARRSDGAGLRRSLDNAAAPTKAGPVRRRTLHLALAASLSLTTFVDAAPFASAATTRVASTVPLLRLGSRGPLVVTLQRRLATLGYWVGPATGVFSDATQQAIFAVQKVASLSRDGVVGPITASALARGVRPRVRSASGYVAEVDLGRNLIYLVRDGHLLITLNASTGGGYLYVSGGVTYRASTPRGRFRVFREVNGLDVSPLGELWRPMYFTGGYAIHGAASVPAYPASHGCVRVSNEAMNWLWATHRLAIGTAVWVY